MAEIVNASADFAHELRPRQRFGPAKEMIERADAVAALRLHFQNAAHARIDQHANPRAFHFKKRICRHGCAVRESADLVGRYSQRQKSPQSFDHRNGLVVQCAGQLLDPIGAGQRVDQHHVGMRAAHIDADTIAQRAQRGRCHAVSLLPRRLNAIAAISRRRTRCRLDPSSQGSPHRDGPKSAC